MPVEVTQKQIARLFAIAKARKWDRDDILALIRTRFGLSLLDHLDWYQYQQLIRIIEDHTTPKPARSAGLKNLSAKILNGGKE